MDYRKFLKAAIRENETYKAIAFGSDIKQNSAIHFKNALKHMGFDLRFKVPKVYKSKKEPGREMRKADWDVGIAMEIVRLLEEFDVLVLGSADGDMVPCVEYILEHGKECRVLASGISKDLRDRVHSYVEITPEFLE